MSSASFLPAKEQFLCSLCLDVFTDPATLPCGHNFCRTCVTRHWDSGTECRCPSCELPFHGRPDLPVNSFISEMAARFRESAGGTGSDRQAARPGDVPCDVCTGRKGKAARSCLVCLASYCDDPLQPHLTVPRLQRHRLTEPVEDLEGRVCAVHDRPLELFCKDDRACVCALCPALDHKSHQVIPLKEQFEEQRAELGRRDVEFQRMIQERQSKVQEIKHMEKLSRQAADRETADGVQVLTGLIRSLERTRAELIGAIEATRKASEEQAEGFVRELEQEVSELIRQRAEVEQLSRTKDHLHFLQCFGSLNASAPARDWKEVGIEPPPFAGAVRAVLDRLEETLGAEVKTLIREAELERLRRVAVDVTLDPDTAHNALILSGDGKRVHHGLVKKNLPDTPDRFNPSCCVLGRQSFSSGRFYFEVEVEGKTRWTLGVARASIKRKGIIPLCPDNGHWTVWLKNGEEYAALVGSPLALPLGSRPRKVGVLVDYEEGLVAFYDVDAANQIYSFTGCSFTEKLLPFFSPGLCDDGVNSAPLVISSTIRNH
ncbi:E3 ubiquitin-protein ligase TRIM39-like [Pungitius pungitius]|uniref:E3 ubiquitin-protein ligase TRIM39-like n=1 Tax=Pungitius pungitius TaxID=134920 RepID=UPI002E13C837